MVYGLVVARCRYVLGRDKAAGYGESEAVLAYFTSPDDRTIHASFTSVSTRFRASALLQIDAQPNGLFDPNKLKDLDPSISAAASTRIDWQSISANNQVAKIPR